MLALDERPKVKRNIVWSAIPNTSQEFALKADAEDILFTGSRGPGKTDTQLMRFYRLIGSGYGRFWRGVIFDRKYKNLDDLIGKSQRWFYPLKDGGRFLRSQGSYKWVWPQGEELEFRHIATASDYWNYHGQEYPFIGWNELCKYPTSELFDLMMSCNRSSFTPEKDTPDIVLQKERKDGSFEILCDRANGKLLAPIPLETFSTTNSYGPGHTWVKQRFIDPAPIGRVVRTTVDVFDPAKKEIVKYTRSQVAIFGTYKENIYLAPAYVARLDAITDPNQRKAWLEGDWDIVAGGAFDDVWNKAVHIVPRFQVPRSWRVDRAFDWGSTHPFSVGWFAEANGEEAYLPNGKSFSPPAGTLIQIDEWYGTDKIGTNQGKRMSAGDIAIGIRDREVALMQYDWIATQPTAGPADNQIRDVRETDVDTIEKKMAAEGIRWIASDKSPGSRRNGLQLVRDRLQASQRREGPGLYFMDNCRASIALIPILPRDEDNMDDVDTTAEDHTYDMVRYRVLHKAKQYGKFTFSLPHS